MKKILLSLVAAAAFAVGIAGANAVEVKAQAGISLVALQEGVSVPLAAPEAPAVMVAAPFVDYTAVKAKLEAGDLLGAVMALLFGAGGVGLAMTTLAADRSRSYELGDYSDLPVVASDIIYEGAAVGDNGTNAHRPLAAGDVFQGFAEATVDNSLGAAGAKNVRVRRVGRVQLPLSGFDVGDIGKQVFASDDDAFTLTQSTNSPIGRAVRFVATGTCIVAFDADNPPPGRLTELTDSSGGTASDTLAAIASTYVEATIENTVASLAAKVNALIRATAN